MKVRSYSFLTLLFVIFFGTSCNKEKITYTEVENAETNTEEFVPYLDLFSTHLKHYKGVNPEIYFSPEFYQEFTSLLGIEMKKIDEIGLEMYLRTPERDDDISPEAKDLLLYVHNSVDTEENVDVINLRQDLIDKHATTTISNEDPYYTYVYSIALQIYDDYIASIDGSSAIPYGDCPFKDFVQHVISSAAAGAGIGGWLGAILQGGEDGPYTVINIFGIAIQITGAVIGGSIGAIVGIFTFDDDGCEDCNAVSFIGITSDTDCNLTRTLYAYGGGLDIAAFDWRITQNGSTVDITTTSRSLSVTQNVASAPLEASVAALCEDGLTGFTTTVPIDFSSSSSSPLGQPGAIEITGGIGDDATTNSFSFFSWTNSNQASGHIVHSFSLSPASIGDITQSSGNTARIDWANTGTATFTVSALNTCSGLTSSSSISITVN